MKSFKLKKSTASTKSLSKFSIMDGDTIVGSINIPPSEENDLRQHWLGANVGPSMRQRAAEESSAKQAMTAAILKGRRMSKQAVLRGC